MWQRIRKVFLLADLILLLNFYLLFSQKIIHGVIQDEQTMEPLPAANIQIEGTFQGTISNDDGAFILKLEEVPATIIVSYIGYATARRTISLTSNSIQNFLLTPIAYELEPIVVTDEDPAIRIMREVIKRKQQWRTTLHTYKVEAYTRMVLENDTSITSIMESISIAYWDKERGVREVAKSKRQTSNISSQENFASAAIVSNLYDDDIDIAGFKIIGVTHPDALDHYHFKLEGQRVRDDQIVYDISVTPKSKLQPTFIGKIAVLDSAYALLEVNLKPSEAVLLPVPIRDFNLQYQQQFSNFGSDYWLPVDVRTNGSIKIAFVGLEFPNIIIKRISRLSNYQINVTLPDSLYQQDKVWLADSSSISQNPDSIFADNPEVVPYSHEEEKAYNTLDSTMTLIKAYRPRGAFARFVEVETENGETKSEKQRGTRKITENLLPVVEFDRVDELTLGLKKTFKFLKYQDFNLFGGYKSGQNHWFWGGELNLKTTKKSRWRTKFHYSHNTSTRYSSITYPTLFTSIHTLFGYSDYFDFYWNEKFRLSFAYSLPKINSHISIGFHNEKHTSLDKVTDYNLLGRDITQRENPEVAEGYLQSVQFDWIIGEDFIPWGIIGQNWAKLTIEHSSPDILSSDFDFTRYQLLMVLRLKTFLQRRLLPNVLDIHLIGGTFNGKLPIQRYGILDGALQIFGPFATFKSLIGKPYEGESYFALYWEHNFRTVPFELIGWRSIAKKHISFLLYGASGRSWISTESFKQLNYQPNYQDHFHHEIGISISGVFQFLRLDLTHRLDQSEIYLGISAARMF
jgi:hypothetical protein